MTATAPPNASLFAFDNSYVRDLGGYYVACGPASAPSPTLLRFNEVLARELGLDPARLTDPRGVGRKQLPTTVIGLLVHIAEHTQRHVGQAISAAKWARIRDLRRVVTGALELERAAKRIRGVRAVANDLVVRVRHARTDDEIARDAARALGLRHSIPVRYCGPRPRPRPRPIPIASLVNPSGTVKSDSEKF